MVLTDCLSLQFAIAYKQFVRTIDQYCTAEEDRQRSNPVVSNFYRCGSY